MSALCKTAPKSNCEEKNDRVHEDISKAIGVEVLDSKETETTKSFLPSEELRATVLGYTAWRR